MTRLPGYVPRDEAQWESRFIDVKGMTYHTRCSLTASAKGMNPIVLVHGLGMSGNYFMPTAERLAANGATVYVPDLPGHGKSDTPEAPLNVLGLADALIDWLDAMGIARVDLVGHSMGCQIAADAAVRFPTRVRRLVLIGPTIDPLHRNFCVQLLRALYACTFERPGLLLHVMAGYWRMGTRLWPEAIAMFHDPVVEKLSCIEQPVLLVRGQRDTIAPQRWLDQASQMTGAERVVTIPNWGHNVIYSAPDAVVAELRPFLGV
ncbi:alpha/beta fold hydrolase [Halomonas korlensis]|uniref:Pimeloyl-ACP methyl ester carboxylesterase n=1 Tax=Halomonas korlensis TaxID=463301 RepID=A0A1I7K2H5_9GAMM|nr:alpha/beta hydrolase [Halomonas korlensis]SFU91589.1 Pimeloyl-ACP methyl ester carboxylesterase [Halomonas korlensis]